MDEIFGFIGSSPAVDRSVWLMNHTEWKYLG